MHTERNGPTFDSCRSHVSMRVLTKQSAIAVVCCEQCVRLVLLKSRLGIPFICKTVVWISHSYIKCWEGIPRQVSGVSVFTLLSASAKEDQISKRIWLSTDLDLRDFDLFPHRRHLTPPHLRRCFPGDQRNPWNEDSSG